MPNNDISAQIKQRVKQHLDCAGISVHDRVLVAVSGGVDSMVLLHSVTQIAQTAGFRVLAFHLDHMYRGDAAIADKQLVRDYCRRLGVPLYSYRRPVARLASKWGIGFEACARQLRYRLIDTLLATQTIRYVLSAHQQDDQVETVLLHLLRGTGLQGLQGISTLAGNRLRPLLAFSKAQLYQAAKAADIPYREDQTNQSLDYTRNRLRLELLPYIKQHFNANIDQAIVQLANLAQLEYQSIDQQSRHDFKRVVSRRQTDWSLEKERYQTLVKARRYHLIRLLFTRLSGNSEDLSYKHVALLDQWILEGELHSKQSFKDLVFNMQRTGVAIAKRGRQSHVKRQQYRVTYYCTEQPPSGACVIVLGVPQHYQSALMRPRQAGDYIKLIGRSVQRKSLKKYLNELKMPLAARTSLQVLAFGSEVLWFEGFSRSIYQNVTALDDKVIYICISKL